MDIYQVTLVVILMGCTAAIGAAMLMIIGQVGFFESKRFYREV